MIKHLRGSRSVVKVEKLTPTQIVVTSGDRFRKRDGYEIGSGGFYHCYITLPKEGEVKSISRCLYQGKENAGFIQHIIRTSLKNQRNTKFVSYDRRIVKEFVEYGKSS